MRSTWFQFCCFLNGYAVDGRTREFGCADVRDGLVFLSWELCMCFLVAACAQKVCKHNGIRLLRSYRNRICFISCERSLLVLSGVLLFLMMWHWAGDSVFKLALTSACGAVILCELQVCRLGGM